MKAVNAYSQDFAVVGEKAYHLGRNEQETQRPHTHQHCACDKCVPQDTAAAFGVLLSVVEADHRDDAGLQCAKWDKEKRLPFVVKAENCDRLI